MGQPMDVQSKEITWEVDGIAIGATLAQPRDGGQHPAILFVAGSGPTDRDWTSPLLPGSNGSGRLLAEALAGDGFVTLRYDKRASGPRARENTTRLAGKVSMQSHVEELAGGVTALVGRPDVDPTRLYALTNSEGAIHALNYQRLASEHRFSALVLTGVPGRSIGDTMRSQVVPQIAALPDGEAQVRHYDKAIADFLAGRAVELDPSMPDGLQKVFLSLSNPANLPFSRELMLVNPARLLREVREPVLIVIGKKDVQANWQVDGQALEAAAAGRENVSLIYPDNANHVLKFEPKALGELTPVEIQTSYNAEDRILDPEALEVIRTWLRQQAGLGGRR
jgi:fermentation-respiration switch protein FrsA (DUF1100 family)